MSWPLRGPFWARRLLAMLMCMALPYGSLGQNATCSISNLPTFPYSELDPMYSNISGPVNSSMSVVYRCKANFHLNPNGNGTITCMNGTWIHSNDSCGPLPAGNDTCAISNLPMFPYSELDPTYSTLSGSVNSSTFVAYRCKANFHLNPNGNGTVTCMNGTWIHSNDSCGPLPGGNDTCAISNLPTFLYSELDPVYSTLSGSVNSSTSVVYRCKANYHLNPNGNGTVSCMNGTWIHSNDSCGPLPGGNDTCAISNLPTFPYSELDPTYSTLSGSVNSSTSVVYQCKANFHLNPNGNGTVTCMNGTWIHRNDSCGPLLGGNDTCAISNLPTFPYSELDPTYSTLSGAVNSSMFVIYRCKANFHLNPNGNGTVTCMNGTWIHSNDSCGPLPGGNDTCAISNLPTFLYSELDPVYSTLSGSVNSSTSVVYRCKANYHLNPNGNGTVSCMNGTWIHSNDSCGPLPGRNDTCLISNLPTFPYSELDLMYSTLSGPVNTSTSVDYRCKQNFFRKPGQVGNVTCVNGSWIHSNDSCGPGCPRPGELQHSKVPDHAMGNNQSFPVGTIFTHECKPGHRITAGLNATSVTCLSNFTWSAATEFCEVPPGRNDTCLISNLPTFPFSELDPMYSTLLGSVNSSTSVAYRCKQNFHRKLGQVGNVTCVNGSWIYSNDSCGPLPGGNDTCAISNLPTFLYSELDPVYSTLSGSVSSSTSVVYQCKANFHLNPNGNGTVSCMNGTWIHSNDSCGPVLVRNDTCLISNLPTFPYSELDPMYSTLSGPVNTSTSVDYQCKQNFFRKPGQVGNVTCVNGSWIHSNDSCGPGCPRPGELQHSKVPDQAMGNNQSFPVGTIFTHECKPGHRIIAGMNASSVTCLSNFTWSAITEFCQVPPGRNDTCLISNLPTFPYSELDPMYSTLSGRVNTSTSVDYRCKQNFFRKPGQVGNVTCVNGSWIHSNDSCEPGCPRPGELQHSKVPDQAMGNNQSFPVGTIFTYECKPGRRIIAGMNAFSVTCLSNFTWSAATEFCQAVLVRNDTCLISNLPMFPYSELDPMYSTLSGRVNTSTSVIYQCKQDFHRKPGQVGNVTCVNGSWIYSSDSCEPGCLRPGELQHSKVPDQAMGNNQSFPVGTIFTYECKPGHRITAGLNASSVTCLSNFTWSAATEFCEVPPGANDTCLISNLPMFPYSEVDPIYSTVLVRVNSSTSVVYRCKQDFFQKPGQVGNVTCVNGSWIHSNDSCEPGCPRPGELQHSKVPDHAIGNNQSFPVGTIFTYECKPGRQIIAGMNASSVTCLSNFTWSAATEFCQAPPGKNDTCSMINLPTFPYSELDPIFSNLSDPINSSIIVVYRCKLNFHRNPYEDGNVICANGSWIHTNDSCGPGCHRPQDLNNSRVPDHVLANKTSFPVGTVLTYECKPDFQRITGMNVAFAICWSNLTWSDAIEFCEAIPRIQGNCYTNLLPLFAYSELEPQYTVLPISVPPFTTVVYQCKANFHRKPDGNGTIWCSNGSWIHSNESCSPGCNRPQELNYSRVPDHVMGINQSFQIGTVFTYECKPGSKIIAGMNASSVTCLNNYTWSATTEFCEELLGNCYTINLPMFPNSEVDLGNTTLPASVPSSGYVVYKCKANFHRNPNRNGTITCMNGSWIHTNDSCDPGCLRPQPLTNAKVPDYIMGNKSSFAVGTILTYECNPGFQIIPGMTASFVMCRGNLTWSNATEFCEGKKENCSMRNLPMFPYSELDPIYSNLTDPLPPSITVVYRCKQDFHRNPYEDGNITCVNGSWMHSNDSCSPGCQRPEDLLFARVPDRVMGNKRTFPVGTVFQYECNPGYQIISGMNPSYAICASNLTWMKTGEFCEAPPVTNDSCATINLPKFMYSELDLKYSGLPPFFQANSTVVYRCKVNFHLKPFGNNTITCVNGSWIHTNESCEPGCNRTHDLKNARIPDPANTFAIGTVVTYQCDPGFQIIPGVRAPSVICRTNLTWSNATVSDFCEALKLNCSTATLPTFVYSELAPKYTNLSDVTFGSNVTYTCKAGFHRIVGENDTVICGNGTWIYNKDSCGPGCQRPANLIYARLPDRVVGNKTSFAIGTVLTYECIPGYKVTYGLTPAQVTCGQNLQWSQATEFCEEIKENCSVADLPRFQYSELLPAYRNLSDMVRNRTQVEVKCKEGFHLNPGRNTILICDSGSWIPNEEPCGAGCHRPKPLKFASVPASAFGNASTFPIGTVFQYVCNPGYINIPGVNLTNVTCRKDNEWTEIAEFCEGDCDTSNLPTFNYSKLKPQFGTLKGFVPPLTEVGYECKEGFYKKPNLTGIVVCMEKVWRYSGDLCGAGCPKPQPIQFAAVPANVLEVNYFPAGTVVTYRCNRGYRIIPGQRPSEATCLQNLTWTKAAEFCEGNCDTRNLPTMQSAELHPKFVNKTGIFPPFTEFVYVCKAGFRRNPDENDTVICMETVWTFNAEPCALSCDLPDPLQNAHIPRYILERNFYPVGIVVAYECNEGYLNVSQPSKVTCQSSLQWTQATVFCQGDCYSRNMPILNYSQPASFYNDSLVVPPLTLMLYECKEGFYRNPYMSDNIVCYEMVWQIDGDPCGPSCLEPPKLQFADIQEHVPINPYFPPGTEFTYKCIQGYDPKDDMEPSSVICQQNLKWSEPKEYCEATVLPETTDLKIRNAKIVRGAKPEYSPGDSVTVQCLPGFTLNGDPVIEYIGGNEWSPRLPSCSLNAIVSTFIAVGAMSFIALLSFGAYKTYSSRISPSQPAPISASKSTIGARPSKITSSKSTASKLTAAKSTASKLTASKSTASKAAVGKKASFRV